VKFVKTLAILILGFLIGVKYDDKDNRLFSLEEKYILKQLIKLSNKPINNIHCELYDNNSLIEKPLVADYLTDYLSFSYYQGKNSFAYFNYHDDDKYDFIFGLDKHPEGYSRILSFSYDKEKQIIDTKSFSCYDVP